MKLPFLNMKRTRFAKVLEYNGKQMVLTKGFEDFSKLYFVEFTGITARGRKMMRMSVWSSEAERDKAFDAMTPEWYAEQIKTS